MYSGVPITSPLRVSASCGASDTAFAMPKSTTFGDSRARRVRATMMLSGLRSRWTMPELVRGGESVGDLARDVDRAPRLERAFAREQSSTAARRRRTP